MTKTTPFIKAMKGSKPTEDYDTSISCKLSSIYPTFENGENYFRVAADIGIKIKHDRLFIQKLNIDTCITFAEFGDFTIYREACLNNELAGFQTSMRGADERYVHIYKIYNCFGLSGLENWVKENLSSFSTEYRKTYKDRFDLLSEDMRLFCNEMDEKMIEIEKKAESVRKKPTEYSEDYQYYSLSWCLVRSDIERYKATFDDPNLLLVNKADRFKALVEERKIKPSYIESLMDRVKETFPKLDDTKEDISNEEEITIFEYD